jgi:Uri superfamily endonuclease
MTRARPKAHSGTYALVLSLDRPTTLRVGRRGSYRVDPGFYVYVGTAFGPGGVKARLAHHRRPARRPHWHIDHLRTVASLEEVRFTHDPIRREHEWADIVSTAMRGRVPIPGFGASDCDCASHLHHFDRPPSGRAFVRYLRSRHPDHATVGFERIGETPD